LSDKKKVGRPPSENPKNGWLHMRLDDDDEKILQNYCKNNNANRADAVREAIQRLNDPNQNYFWTAEWRDRIKQIEAVLKGSNESIYDSITSVINLINEMNQKSKEGCGKK
jgi:hypothetical protein